MQEYFRLVEFKFRECAIQLTDEWNATCDIPPRIDENGDEPQARGGTVRREPPTSFDLLTTIARSLRETLVTRLRDRTVSRQDAGHDHGFALDEIIESFEGDNRFDLVAVDSALAKLNLSSAFRSELVELQLFMGVTVERIADLLGESSAQVSNDLRFSLAVLYRELEHPMEANQIGRLPKIEDLFAAALDMADNERERFLGAECRDDPGLQAEVGAILAADKDLQVNADRFRCPFESNLVSWFGEAFETHSSFDTKNLERLLSCTTKQTPDDSDSTLDHSFTPWQHESELAGSSQATEDAKQHGKPEFDWSVPTIPGFEIIQEIGRGGMGVVYRAMDLRSGEVVALKTMLHADSRMLARFKKEFRSLSNVVHPNLAKLYELAFYKGLPYFTMEYVLGRDFRTYVREGLRADQPMSDQQWRRLRAAVIQLAEGVSALHAANKVHRDIKPSNILVTASGRVVILDFGLAIELNADGTYETVNQHISGTPAFMSPEQSVGGRVTAASDWYSVGVVLYEAISGRMPFRAGKIATRKERVNILPLNVVGVPSGMAELCRDLLRFNPALRPSGDSVLSRIGKPASVHVPKEAENRFIGREKQLQQLRDSYQTLLRNRAVAVLIGGQSGAGKSALMRQFVEEVRNEPDLLVLSGRCYKQETVPYKAVDELVDSLGRYLCSLTHEQCDAFLPRDTAALAQVFPTLQQVDAIRRAPTRGLPSFDKQELRQRAFAALRELLTRIGDRKQLVLVIDDLQWGDADSTALLNFVLRQPDGPVAFFLGCFRSEDLESSECLTSLVAELQDADQISLDSLSEPQSYRLAQTLLGDWTTGDNLDEVARRIAVESLGNPFFLRELVTGVVQGVSTRPGGQSLTLEELLWSRIQQLPDQMRAFLCTLSIAGQPLQQEYASVASNLDAANISETLKILRDEHLIRDCGSEEEMQIDTYHDRIREIVFARLDADSQKECHRRLAETGEARPNLDVKFLALHFRNADQPEKAARYYVQAADEDAEKLAFNQAANHYADALRLHAFSIAEQLDVRTKMAAALSSDCRCVEAAKEYLTLAELEGSNRLEMLRQAFTQYISIGRLDDGMSIVDSALSLLGMKLPRTPGRALASLMFARVRLWLRGLSIQLRDPADISPADLLRVDVLWSVAICLTTIDHIRAEAFVSKACFEALRVGEPGRIALTLATEGGHLATPGRFFVGRSARILKLANEVLSETDDPFIASQVRLCEGIRAALLGDWDTCYSNCADAERGSLLAHEFFHCATARFWKVMSLFWLGRLAELQEDCPKIVGSAEARGDLFELVGTGALPMSVVRLAQDKPREALDELNTVMSNWIHDGFHVQHHLGIVARASILLYEGKLIEAESVLKESWSIHKQSLLFFAQLVRVHLYHLRARIALQSIGKDSPYSNPTRVARKALRSLMREKRPWTTALAIAGQGSLAAKLGDTQAAKKHLSKAATSFAALGLELYEAAASRHLGQLERGSFGRSKIETADTWMTQQQRIVAPERMAEFLVPGSNTPRNQT